MLGSIFETLALRATRTALDGLSQREAAIASNVANIDTPGYQRRGVSFEDALNAQVRGLQGGTALARTDERHVAARTGGGLGEPSEISERDVVSSRNDGNNVSIDEEMSLLVETQLRYQALTDTLGRRLATLRTVIRG